MAHYPIPTTALSSLWPPAQHSTNVSTQLLPRLPVAHRQSAITSARCLLSTFRNNTALPVPDLSCRALTFAIVIAHRGEPNYVDEVGEACSTRFRPGTQSANRHALLFWSATAIVFFGCIFWVRTGDPVFGTFPTNLQTLKGITNGLAGDLHRS